MWAILGWVCLGCFVGGLLVFLGFCWLFRDVSFGPWR